MKYVKVIMSLMSRGCTYIPIVEGLAECLICPILFTPCLLIDQCYLVFDDNLLYNYILCIFDIVATLALVWCVSVAIWSDLSLTDRQKKPQHFPGHWSLICLLTNGGSHNVRWQSGALQWFDWRQLLVAPYWDSTRSLKFTGGTHIVKLPWNPAGFYLLESK